MKNMKRVLSFVLVFIMVLSFNHIQIETIYAEDVNTYVSSCTMYDSSLTVRTKTLTSLMTYPCSSSTNNLSAVSLQVIKGTDLNVYALYKNTVGEYWYKVIYFGKTLFVKAVDTEMVLHQIGDVTIKDPVSPASLGYGHGFPIGGTIQSTYNKIGKITASMYTGINTTVKPYLTSSDTANSKSYSLQGSTVDNNLWFNQLAKGDYTYVVEVEAICNYIDDSGALKQTSKIVELEKQKCIVTNASSPNAVAARGIDVSTHQGNIDWSLASKEIDFAILRASYSTTTDDKFYRNADACTQYGVPFGVYVYSYATTVAEVQAEANHVVSLIKNYDLALPVFFDFEDPSQAALSTAQKKELIKGFIDVIKAAGYEPGLYSFLSWFDSNFSDSYFNSLPKWIAQIEVSNCSYTRGVRMWQYSWTGRISGISGDVDCNYYYGTFPGTNPDTSYLNKCTYYPSNLDIKTTEDDVMIKSYPCWYGTDNSSADVEEVAKGTQLHVTGMYKNSVGEYWYQVENGSTYGYILAERTTVTGYNYDDIFVNNPQMADNLAVDAGYPIAGTMQSRYNKMSTINAKIYNNENVTGEPVLSSSYSANTDSYKLKGSEVDDALWFSELDEGYYTYELSADVENYYLNSSNVLTKQTENVVVWTKTFTVGSSNISHSHTIVNDAAVAATCKQTGLTAGTHCSTCNEVITAQTVVAKKNHTPGAAVRENEVSGVSYDSVVYCTVCTHEISRTRVNISSGTDDDNRDDGKTDDDKDDDQTDNQTGGNIRLKDSFLVSKIKDCTYTGKAVTQNIKLVDGDKVLVKGVDYSVTYRKNVNVGTATVVIVGKGKYEDSIVRQFKIKKKPVADLNIKLSKSRYTYTGLAIKPPLTVKNGNKNLTLNKDYKVTYKNNKNVGLATVNITLIGNYTGSVSRKFEIIPQKVKVNKQTKYITDSITLKWNKVNDSTGYEIFSSSKKNGTYSKIAIVNKKKVTYKHNRLESGKTYYYKIRAYKIVGKSYIYGEFSEIITAFTKPETTKIRLTTEKGRVTVNWNKVNGVKGYEVYMSTSKKGKYTKISTVKASKTKLKKSKLTSGKTYYFKVRAYNKASKDKNIYGSFSRIRWIKVK